jgi:hypothetical protein
VEDPEAMPRRGVYFRSGLAGGTTLGRYELHDSMQQGGARPATRVGFDQSSADLGYGVEVGLGYGLTHGLALALVGSYGASPVDYEFGNTTFSGMEVVNLGLLADYYPDPRGRWNIVVGVGRAQVEYSGDDPEGYLPGTYSLDGAWRQPGITALLGGGFTWWKGFSFEARLVYLRTRTSQGPQSSELTALTPQLVLVGKSF